MSTEVRVAVVLGGAVGTLLRWGVVELVDVGRFPLATLLVNLVGAYALARLASSRPDASPREAAFLGTGLVGSFTTFSAVVVDLIALGNRPVLLAVYAVVTLAGGLWLAQLGSRHGAGPGGGAGADVEVAA